MVIATAELGGELADVTVGAGMNDQRARVVTGFFLSAAELIA